MRQWFDDVRQRNFAGAVEWMLDPRKRLRPGEDVAQYYRDEPRALNAVRELAERPLVAFIASLGMDSQVRYLETQFHHLTAIKERVASLWAVTYQEDGKRKSILVRTSLERDAKDPPGKNQWAMTKVDLVMVPPDWLKP